jgi:hypothetical protein
MSYVTNDGVVLVTDDFTVSSVELFDSNAKQDSQATNRQGHHTCPRPCFRHVLCCSAAGVLLTRYHLSARLG